MSADTESRYFPCQLGRPVIFECHAIAISGKAIDIDFVIFIQSLRNITRLETNNKITIYVQYYKFSEKVNTLIYGSKYT